MFLDLSAELAQIVELLAEAIDIRVLVGIRGVTVAGVHLILVDFFKKLLAEFVRKIAEMFLAVFVPG